MERAMYDNVTRPLDALIPYAKNSRTHDDEQVAQIAGSIKEWGFTNPVLIDESDVIIAGHGRVLAARKLGLVEVPCVVLAGLSEEQKSAYVIADNKLALNAGWDMEMLSAQMQELDASSFDLSLIGFADTELQDLVAKPMEGLTDDDEVPEPPETPITVEGDVWILGNHRLMCGDSTSPEHVDRLLSGSTIDLIFTDPPYGVSYADKNEFLNGADKGNRIQREIKNDHLDADQCGKLWADTFSLWAQYQSEYSSYYIASPQGGDLFLMMMMMNDNGLPLRHTIIWAKNNHVLGRCDYNYKHEPILYGWTKRHKFYGKGEHKFSVWNINKPNANKLHPTMKPVELVENCILNSSASNQVVGDMFGGSGTTLIACEKTNRNCYMMELDPIYCDVIINRWQDYTGKQAVHENGTPFPQKEVA